MEQRNEPRISLDNVLTTLREISENEIEEINFVGGEPMLHPFIDEAIIEAKRLGLTTSIVSNGARMDRGWLTRMRAHLDWLGLSIDAPDDETHAEMGRGLRGEIASGHSNHLQRSMAVWGMARELGYGLKLNTMVDSRNSRSDMSSLVRSLAPDRWKVFQFLHIEGENDRASGYAITARSSGVRQKAPDEADWYWNRGNIRGKR